MIPLVALARLDVSRLSRAALRTAWHLALWAWCHGLVSRETFLRIDDAYYRRLIIEGWRRAA